MVLDNKSIAKSSTAADPVKSRKSVLKMLGMFNIVLLSNVWYCVCNMRYIKFLLMFNYENTCKNNNL